jgi:hypothetical protein
MPTTNFAEQWTSMTQKMFLPTSPFSPMLRENARHFWENQEKILNSMQAFTNGWFERRHTGAHSASEVCERMCGTETAVDAVQAYQDWLRGAFERMMADGLACQQIIAATSTLASPPIAPSTSEKATEPARSETRTPARAKAP